MPLIVIANETSIDALKDRLFKPGVSDADIARLHRAIKKANPGIDLTNLRPGTILTLPDAPEFVARADGSVGAVVSDAVGVARGDLGSRLEELAASARVRARADQNERKQLVGLLDSAEVRRMVDQDPASSEAWKAAREALVADDRTADGTQEGIKQALSEWSGELTALDGLVP